MGNLMGVPRFEQGGDEAVLAYDPADLRQRYFPESLPPEPEPIPPQDQAEQQSAELTQNNEGAN